MQPRKIIAAASTVVSLVLLSRFRTPATSSAAPAGSKSSGSTATGAESAQQSPVAGPPAQAATAGSYADGTYAGQDFSMQFGDVQVQVVISGHRITDVKALQLPFDRPRSQFISQVAGPYLHDEVLHAQSAQIDGVSGATYTSYAYAESTQSALDKAHAAEQKTHA